MHAVLPNIFSDYVNKDIATWDWDIKTSAGEDIERLRAGYPSYSDMLKNYSIDLHENMDIECDLCIEKKSKLIKYVKSTGVCYIIDAGEIKPLAERGTRVPQLRISYRESEQAKYSKDVARSLLQQSPTTSTSPTPSPTDYELPMEGGGGFESSTPSLKRKKRDNHGGPGLGYYYYYGIDDESHDNSSGLGGGGIEIKYQEMPSLRLMFGEQARKFDEFGDVKLEVGMDATVLLGIIRKTMQYENGRCLRQEDLTGSEYTPCMENCINQEMREGCGRYECYDYLGEIGEEFLYRSEGLTYYHAVEEIECKEYVQQECWKVCIGPCEEFFYEPSVMPTQSKINDSEIADSMDIIIRPLHPESLLWLAEVPIYTWDTLLSNVGGMLGLFCGASLLSVVHMMYFCVVTCCQKCHRKLQSTGFA